MATKNNHSQQLCGELPAPENFTPISGLSSNVIEDKLVLEHSVWKERVIKIIGSLDGPFGAKKISEILHDHYQKLCISTIHLQVLKVFRMLLEEGVLEKKKTTNNKYVACRRS